MMLKKVLTTISKNPGHKILELCADDYFNERIGQKHQHNTRLVDKFDITAATVEKKHQLDRIIGLLLQFEQDRQKNPDYLNDINPKEMKEIVDNLPFAGYSHIDNNLLYIIFEAI